MEGFAPSDESGAISRTSRCTTGRVFPALVSLSGSCNGRMTPASIQRLTILIRLSRCVSEWQSRSWNWKLPKLGSCGEQPGIGPRCDPFHPAATPLSHRLATTFAPRDRAISLGSVFGERDDFGKGWITACISNRQLSFSLLPRRIWCARNPPFQQQIVINPAGCARQSLGRNHSNRRPFRLADVGGIDQNSQALPTCKSWSLDANH